MYQQTITKSERLGNTKGRISTQRDTHRCKQSCCPYHTCLNSLVMTYQVSLYTMICCELYMVSQTDNCELYLSYELIRRARVFSVRNLLRKSYRICCVTRQESIQAVAYFPTRDRWATFPYFCHRFYLCRLPSVIIQKYHFAWLEYTLLPHVLTSYQVLRTETDFFIELFEGMDKPPLFCVGCNNPYMPWPQRRVNQTTVRVRAGMSNWIQ